MVTLAAMEDYAATREHNQLEILYKKTAADGGIEGSPYTWQCKFHDAGAEHSQRAIIAGNRTGKTRSAAAEIAMHLTGLYPTWWRGKRFDREIVACVAGITNEDTRNIVQTALFGPMADGEKRPSGTGWVPQHLIGANPGFRSTGVSNVMEMVRVKHRNGRWSYVMLKSYEQKAIHFQGFEADLMWFDEEPTEEAIFSEALTRLVDRSGIFILTRTPLLGLSKIIKHFMDSSKPGWYIHASWDDAPHLDKKARAELLASYEDHEVETRVGGIPMMGSGAVYPVSQRKISCEPFEIPAYYRRVKGVDFGIDHYGACASIAHDPDADIVYVYDCYREKGWTALQHAHRINMAGKWIPVAFPHDGMARDKGSGKTLRDQYAAHGCNMMSESARYDDDKGGAQGREPMTIAILERMNTGRFKVFGHLAELFEELRFLIRKDGVIVPQNDDIESAVRYAMMMLRYAVADNHEVVMQTSSRRPGYDPFRRRRR